MRFDYLEKDLFRSLIKNPGAFRKATLRRKSARKQAAYRQTPRRTPTDTQTDRQTENMDTGGNLLHLDFFLLITFNTRKSVRFFTDILFSLINHFTLIRDFKYRD